MNDRERLRTVADNIENFWLQLGELANKPGAPKSLAQVAREDAETLREIAEKLPA